MSLQRFEKKKITVFSEYMFVFETYQNKVWMQKCGKKVFFLNIDILWVASWEILQKFLSKFILFKINSLKNDFPKKKKEFKLHNLREMWNTIFLKKKKKKLRKKIERNSFPAVIKNNKHFGIPVIYNQLFSLFVVWDVWNND